VAIDQDTGEGESSLAFVGDQIEDIGAKRLKDSLTVFSYEVSVGASCESDSEVRG